MTDGQRVFRWFMVSMVLLGLIGAALLVYGSIHGEPHLPLLPDLGMIARHLSHG